MHPKVDDLRHRSELFQHEGLAMIFDFSYTDSLENCDLNEDN